MITLQLIEDLFVTFQNFLLKIPIVANVIDTFSNLADELSWVTIPDNLINIFRLARLFLPTGTIVILFSIGGLMISFALITGFIRFLTHMGNIL